MHLKCNLSVVSGELTHSVQRRPTGWTVRSFISVGGEIFPVYP